MGDTGCNLVLLGQYNLVLIGIEWYWVNKGLLCLYILKKINGDVDQPTDQQGEYRAICLFRKLENRKKAEICNLLGLQFQKLVLSPRMKSYLFEMFNSVLESL